MRETRHRNLATMMALNEKLSKRGVRLPEAAVQALGLSKRR